MQHKCRWRHEENDLKTHCRQTEQAHSQQTGGGLLDFASRKNKQRYCFQSLRNRKSVQYKLNGNRSSTIHQTTVFYYFSTQNANKISVIRMANNCSVCLWEAVNVN